MPKIDIDRLICHLAKYDDFEEYLKEALEGQGLQIRNGSITPISPETEHKFKMGDWICRSHHALFIENIQMCESEGTCNYVLENPLSENNPLTLPSKPFDEDYHLWAIDDAEDGDFIFHVEDNGDGRPNYRVSIFSHAEGGQLYTHASLDMESPYKDKNLTVESKRELVAHQAKNITWIAPSKKDGMERLLERLDSEGYKWIPDEKRIASISGQEPSEAEKLKENISDIAMAVNELCAKIYKLKDLVKDKQ